MRATRHRLFLLSAAVAAGIVLFRFQAARPAALDLGRCPIPELAARLADRLPHLRVTPSDSGGRFLGGFYLTSDPGPSLVRLDHLPRQPGPHWRGVVLCCWLPPNVIPAYADWGEQRLTACPFDFVGDPDLLREIGDALREIHAEARPATAESSQQSPAGTPAPGAHGQQDCPRRGGGVD